jgi:hypothetical protein
MHAGGTACTEYGLQRARLALCTSDLALQVVVLADESGEFARLVQARAQETRNHLDD